MDANYKRFGLPPDCSMHQLRRAYRKQRRLLPRGDAASAASLTQDYRTLKADVRTRSFPHRFGLATLGSALGIVVLGCLLHKLLSDMTPSLFPASAYPELALRFSKALAGYGGHLLFYLACIVIYVFRCLRRRRATGMRHLLPGFLFGCGVLAFGFFFPTNLFGNTVNLLCDVNSLQTGNLQVIEHVRVSPALAARLTVPFGEPLRAGPKLILYYPAEIYRGDGDIATVRYLKHTRAAAEITVESTHTALNTFSGGTVRALDAAGRRLSLQEDTGILEITDKFGVFARASLPEASDGRLDSRYPVGLTFLPSGDAFAFYAARQHPSTRAVTAVIDASTGEIKSTQLLNGEAPCTLCQNGDLILLLSRRADSASFLKQFAYYLDLYDTAAGAFVYRSAQPVFSRVSLTVGGFEGDAVLLADTSHSESEKAMRFSIPADLMERLRAPIAVYR